VRVYSHVVSVVFGDSSYQGIAAVTSFLYGKEVSDIACNKCPFCGRVFRNHRSLKYHLKMNRKCRFLFYNMISDIEKCYKQVSSLVRFVMGRYHIVGHPESFLNVYDVYYYVLEAGLVECERTA